MIETVSKLRRFAGQRKDARESARRGAEITRMVGKELIMRIDRACPLLKSSTASGAQKAASVEAAVQDGLVTAEEFNRYAAAITVAAKLYPASGAQTEVCRLQKLAGECATCREPFGRYKGHISRQGVSKCAKCCECAAVK